MIQFASVTLLYLNGMNLTDYQYLYIDLVILVPLSMLMGKTEPYSYLTPHMPAGSLISLPVLASVIGSVVIQISILLFSYLFVKQQSFFQPKIVSFEESHDFHSYENSVLFIVSCFQYLITCLSFSISKPFRKPLYTNYPFTISLGVLFLTNFYFLLPDDNWLI